jgi:hypothetical protein
MLGDLLHIASTVPSSVFPAGAEIKELEKLARRIKTREAKKTDA